METVKRLHRAVRDVRATYKQSMKVLRMAKELNPAMVTKTSIMLGLGETETEVREVLKDLREVGVSILTFGQYLQPTAKHLEVERYVTPKEFDRWKVVAEEEFGFAYCASGPMVRSSYKAAEVFLESKLAV
jgi:lipoic acid synthetase